MHTRHLFLSARRPPRKHSSEATRRAGEAAGRTVPLAYSIVRAIDWPVSLKVNLARLVEPGQVNVSYGVFREWRRQGLALRALDLMDKYLRTATEARQIVLRIAPENTASLKLAVKAGFTFRGLFDEPEGLMARYVREVPMIRR